MLGWSTAVNYLLVVRVVPGADRTDTGAVTCNRPPSVRGRMVEVQPHNRQHELADEIPLSTGPATVTDVDTLDRDRSEEVREGVERVLARHDKEDWFDELGTGGGDIDWDRLWSLLHEHNLGGGLEGDLRTLQERFERAEPALVRVRFDPHDETFSFVPGEYATVHYGHVPRPYSIASSPNADHIEICVRRVPNGKLSTKLCEGLDPGEEFTVRGPFGGEFVLQDPSHRDMVFMATGTGVAPLRSMIEYTFEEGLDEHGSGRRNVWLFLGASWEDDLPYREAFRDLAAERENFHFVPTVTREEYLSDWDGESDYVQRVLMKYLDPDALESEPGGSLSDYVGRETAYDVDARIDPDRTEVYACGINAMVHQLVDAVQRLGVPENHIRSEGFG